MLAASHFPRRQDWIVTVVRVGDPAEVIGAHLADARPILRAPRLVPQAAHQRADRREGCATAQSLRLSGAAHQQAQRQADAIGAAHRACVPRSRQRAGGPSGQARLREWTGPPRWPALDYLQVRQQSCEEVVLQEGRG